jgi:hypothetical protein
MSSIFDSLKPVSTARLLKAADSRKRGLQVKSVKQRTALCGAFTFVDHEYSNACRSEPLSVQVGVELRLKIFAGQSDSLAF